MFNSLASSAATVLTSLPASKAASPTMEANEKQKAEYQTALSILQAAGITNGQQELQEKIVSLAKLEGDSSHCSVASTRATSPSSSTGSSEDASGTLARRRGRSVLMLNELVVDLEPEKAPGGSPPDSTSTRCTAWTPQIIGFSPPTSMGGSSLAQRTTPSHLSFSPPSRGSALSNQVVETTMIRTSPLQRFSDASQRSPACLSRVGGAAAGGDASQRSPNCASRLGGMAAGGDASRRTPIARVTLGVATIGGDASRRSPPGPANQMAECSLTQMLPPRLPFQGCDVSRPNPNCSATPNITSTSFAALGKDSSRSSSMQDASQRNPDGSAVMKLTFEGNSDALKSWLAGASSSSPESHIDLAERLQAAAPESYED